MLLITDGSVNPKYGIGIGAYLIFSDITETLDSLGKRIKLRKFENTSSTKLELQALIWALSETTEKEIVSYTDSQNIVSLLSRKKRLVGNNFCSKGGKKIRNHEIYKEFFESIRKVDIQFHLLKGHKPSRSKGRIDEIFSVVDRATRNMLRTYLKEKFQPVAGTDSAR